MPQPGNPASVIRQVVPLSLTLQGNGTTNTFTFKIPELMAVNSAGKGSILNTRPIPIEGEGAVAEQPENRVTVAIVPGPGLITLTFQDPLPADQPSTVNLKLYFEPATV